jgi:UPF0176 protein
MTHDVLNIAAYKFVTLDDVQDLREPMLAAAEALGLKGKVLLAPEGINLFLAGPADAVRAYVLGLRRDPRLADLPVKESWSSEVPFKRMLVKVKGEIIRMNHPMVRPDRAPRAPAVDPLTLKRWLDQGCDDAGRPVVMLDTRNAFEVDLGKFAGAVDWRIGKFSDFPQALQAHAAELAGKTVVSYCTGGIRCEKAAMVMAQLGAGAGDASYQTFQLDGGILNYLEKVAAADPGATKPHWQGECFVFDHRVALDEQLSASSTLPPSSKTAPRGFGNASTVTRSTPRPGVLL